MRLAISNGFVSDCLAISKQTEEDSSPNWEVGGKSRVRDGISASGKASSIALPSSAVHWFLNSPNGLVEVNATMTTLLSDLGCEELYFPSPFIDYVSAGFEKLGVGAVVLESGHRNEK